MFNCYRFYKNPGQSNQQSGLHTLVAFFSNRVIRGGPKIFIHLAACLVVLVLIVKLAPGNLFGSLSSTTSFFDWDNPTQSPTYEYEPLIQNNDENLKLGTPGSGLRIVVFGENDIATPSRAQTTYRAAPRRPSWTELLCHELHCSSYLSFTPNSQGTSYPVVSHDLHNAAIKVLLRETGGSNSPGTDYTFYPKQFPVDKALPDLARQVQSFLAMNNNRKPASTPSPPPSETLWVFTPGWWDVWALASMPIGISRPLVGLLVAHVFEQIELVYQSSLDTNSVAFSDPNRAGANTTTPTVSVIGSEASKNSTEQSSNNGRRAFHILVPTLFDPSLMPGWARSRAAVPGVHSKAEQQRNAVSLAEEWNDQVEIRMAQWVEKSDRGVSSEKSGGKKNEKKKGKGKKEKSEHKDPDPLRDGFLYDMERYLVEAMLHQQLRNAGLSDQNGLGKHPLEEGIRDVRTACADDDGSVSKGKKGAAAASAGVAVCRAPGEHLFYAPFELGTAAVATIARQVAGMARRGETVRAAWAAEAGMGV